MCLHPELFVHGFSFLEACSCSELKCVAIHYKRLPNTQPSIGNSAFEHDASSRSSNILQKRCTIAVGLEVKSFNGISRCVEYRFCKEASFACSNIRVS